MWRTVVRPPARSWKGASRSDACWHFYIWQRWISTLVFHFSPPSSPNTAGNLLLRGFSQWKVWVMDKSRKSILNPQHNITGCPSHLDVLQSSCFLFYFYFWWWDENEKAQWESFLASIRFLQQFLHILNRPPKSRQEPLIDDLHFKINSNTPPGHYFYRIVTQSNKTSVIYSVFCTLKISFYAKGSRGSAHKYAPRAFPPSSFQYLFSN